MRRASRSAAAALGAVVTLILTGLSSGTTYARFSDFVDVPGSAGAGVWAPDPPAECGPLSDYDSVVYGTMGDDVLGSNEPPDGNRRQIVMGYGGDDTLLGGTQGDCLVGGPGDDHLYGNNARDILLGGPGDDYLDGGNAKDVLDGDAGADTCLGGNGDDTIVHCESTTGTPLFTTLVPQAEVADDQTTPSPAAVTPPADPVDEPSSEAVPPPGAPTGEPDSGADATPVPSPIAAASSDPTP